MRRLLKIILITVCIALMLPVCSEVAYAAEQGSSEQVLDETAPENQTPSEEPVEKEKFELWVSSAKASSVTLKWDKITNATKYYVYRSERKKSGYKKIATLSAKKRTYKDSKLKENKTYYYKVQVKRAKGSKLTSNIKTKVKVRGDYKRGSVYGPSLSTKQLNQVKDYVANFVNKYTEPEMDDFIKVFFAHNYICNTVSYEDRGWWVNDANTALGALKYKRAQCSGYARSFKALCDGMGIECKFVHANKNAFNPSHQWNLVKVDKKWYLIDLQLNDNSGGYMVFLWGSDSLNYYADGIYEYNKKGMPKLSKKNYDYSKYSEFFE